MRFFLLLFFFASAVVFSAEVTSFFSPEDHLAKRLIEEIAKEKKSIKLAAYSFTHKAVAAALVEAKKRGVDVEILLDRFSLRAPHIVESLVEANIPVYVWQPSEKKFRSMMHNKFCLLGDKAVWTGSFNFTYSGDKKNCENAVLIIDPLVAGRFASVFISLKSKSSLWKVEKAA